MCILFHTVSHPGYQLILASNRDEYFDRPALPAQWHTFADIAGSSRNNVSSDDGSNQPWILSGRDLGHPSGGTWLGMTRDLRIGIVTNVRDVAPAKPRISTPSRGLLLKSFLSPPPSSSLPTVRDYLTEYSASASEYEGFNLLLFKLPVQGDGKEPELGCLSNRPSPTLTDMRTSPSQGGLGVGIGRCHGLSNTPLSQPWPKVIEGERRMSESLRNWNQKDEGDKGLVERMMQILHHTIPLTSLADAKSCTCLQPTLIGKNPEVPPTSPTEGRWYGTRVSTVILVKDIGEVIFVERDIGEMDDEGGARRGMGERNFTFEAEGARM